MRLAPTSNECVGTHPIAARSSSKTPKSSRTSASTAISSSLTLEAPKCARAATPGSFVHLSCDESLPMRRPLSIMRAHPRARLDRGALQGRRARARLAVAASSAGDRISALGPIGNGFVPHPRASAHAAGRRRRRHSADGVPRRERCASDTRRAVEAAGADGLGDPVSLPRAALDDPRARHAGRRHRLHAACSTNGASPAASPASRAIPGCYEGYVTDLAAAWLASLDRGALAEVEMFACGPTPMLKAAAAVARRFDIPCQVSLEEFMACAVGGCAGCAVRVETPSGPAMKRVCVDGPVFDAQACSRPEQLLGSGC